MGWGLTLLQSYSQCIQQLQPTGQSIGRLVGWLVGWFFVLFFKTLGGGIQLNSTNP